MNQLGKGGYLENVINPHSNTSNHMKITHFSAENDEENNYFMKYENIFILTVQNEGQAISDLMFV